MNFFGLGVMELFLVLLVALVVLGPSRTVNMAKGAGKMLGEVRRAMGDLSRAVEQEGWEPDDHGGKGTNSSSREGKPTKEQP